MSSQQPQLWEVRFRITTPPGGQTVNLRETCEQAGFRFLRAPNVFSWCIDAGGKEHAIVAVRTYVHARLQGQFEVVIESVRPGPHRPSQARLGAVQPNTVRPSVVPAPEDRISSALDRLRTGVPKAENPTFGLRLRSDGLCEANVPPDPHANG